MREMDMFAKNPLIYLAKKTWEHSAGNRHMVLIFLSLFVVGNTIDFFVPIVFARVVNIIQQEVTKYGFISFGGFVHACHWLSLFIVIELLFWFCHGPARIIERTNAFLSKADYKKYLLKGITNFPMQWHVEHHTGNTIDKIEKGTTAILNFSEGSFEIIEMLAQLFGSAVALLYFNPSSSYLVAFMVFAVAIIVIRFDRILIPQYKELNRAENKVSEKIIDAITNISTIIILRVEKHILETMNRKIIAPLKLYKKNIRLNEFKWFLVAIISSLSMVWVLGTFLYHSSVNHSALQIGTFIALYQYVYRMNETFFRFAGKYSQIVRQRTSVANAEEIADEFQTQEKITPAILNGRWRKLEIKDLSFSYHTADSADLHLDGISLDIKNGERIALTGLTGSGKSTLLKVIRDLYSPKTLDLYLEGNLVKDGFKAIGPEIALIPQDPEIFSTTILENITFGVECEMSEVIKYTNMACFTDVALGLPKKWHSSIKEKGVNLSGGERQRLALARGLMASEDKAIVLLDEPTSSVDVVTEEQIFRNIFNALTDKAIICSLHSIHLLPLFDHIYVFNDGKITASGTFNELMEASEEFRNEYNRVIQAEQSN